MIYIEEASCKLKHFSCIPQLKIIIALSIEKMLSVGFFIATVITIWISRWVYRWRNPKCNGVLPPGSMGFPIIGETFQIFAPSYSFDIPFINKKIQRYGPIFKTSFLGDPLIISADLEFNNHLLKQEGKQVEFWYMKSFNRVFFPQAGEARVQADETVHKYLRATTLNHFGVECIKESLIAYIERLADQTLSTCSKFDVVDANQAISNMAFSITSKLIVGKDSPTMESLMDKISKAIVGFTSFNISIPGSAFYKCLKDKAIIFAALVKIIRRRIALSEVGHEDLINDVIEDMSTRKFLTESFIPYFLFGTIFASFKSLAMTMTMVLKFLADNSAVLDELTAEHGAILKRRKDPDSALTWEEYKSMTLTLDVIDETVRLGGGILPGLFRRAMTDIHINGYTIPAGWTIMIDTNAHHLDEKIFENPCEFNPWRWKDIDKETALKSFMPFGRGSRQCTGSEYARAFMATFLHVLVTKYRWKKIQGGEVVRNFLLRFRNGFYIKVEEK
ncbi:hypothetical protein Droror1_Dr00017375 [Drosera rotundifolia]